MKTIAAALAGGRFVTRWTFVAVFAVSLIVLAPLPAALTPVERATVSLMTAAMFAAAWGLVAVIERRMSAPVARAAIVATALVVTAILRPVGQDALSLALGLPAPTPDTLPLRAATNLAVWTIALIGTAVLVGAARATRETDALLRAVLAQLRSSADRVADFRVDAHRAVSAAAAAIGAAQPVTTDDVRALATQLRTHAHALGALADGLPSQPTAPAARARPPRGDFRLPPVGLTAAVYGVAVFPYAVRTIAPIDLALGLSATVVLGLLADTVPRLPRLRRARIAGGAIFAVAVVAVGVVLAAIGAAQGVPFPASAVPALAYPALAAALARWRGGARTLAVERRRLSGAIAERVRADDLGTRAVRAGLHEAAERLHRDGQGAAVQFVLRHPDPGPDELAAFRAELAAVADGVRRALDAPATGAGAASLDALLATWARAMPVDAHVTDAARGALRTDPALARDVIDVVAEGLLNAAKHARERAAAVAVELRATAGGPRLDVRVASPGAPPRGAALRAGARAHALGARLRDAGDTAVLEARFAIADTDVVSAEHSAEGSPSPA
ncbi:hypothetical protein [Microbacterium sp.]|uniref:hypothetical protein n=1 Tax=Microbacterium sp. TaxID=51671 RepID=UPI0025D9F5FC|nr:hypothetical protein [Microbacterium sp.]MBT9607355.1 hypothetical protein [Microbacterium sp.]